MWQYEIENGETEATLKIALSVQRQQFSHQPEWLIIAKPMFSLKKFAVSKLRPQRSQRTPKYMNEYSMKCHMIFNED